MWEFERMLGLVWRIDVRMVDGVLLVHPVVHNHTAATVPVYWWSNTAVPLEPDSRVLAPATEAWHYDERSLLDLVPVPGTPDATRPGQRDGAADHFFRIAGRPWIAAVGADGTGLGQASTSRLPGRKLFRWGTGTGGRRWQRWLSPSGGDYLEIQAGLATTQLEHLPLPAGEVWEWTEAYGLVAPGDDAHGEWERAVESGARAIDAMIGGTRLGEADERFAALRERPAEVATTASGWGALEVIAGASLSAGTPFPASTLGALQRPWVEFVTSGEFPSDDTLPAPVAGERWRALLSSPTGWRECYLAALSAIADGRPAEAERLLRSSVADRPSWQALRALAHLSPHPERADLLVRAWHDHAVVPLLVEALGALHEAGRATEMLKLIDTLDDDARRVPRVRLAEARAAVRTGDLSRAGGILDGGALEVPDLREGEDSLADLWFAYQAAAGTNAPLPAAYDFRMH